MSTIQQEVTQKTVGFSWHISIETEKRTATDAKYPDKTVSKASLGGHADSYEDAVSQLREAKAELKKE